MSTIKELQKKIHDIEEQHQVEISELKQKLNDMALKYEEKIEKLTEKLISDQKEFQNTILQTIQNIMKASTESMKLIVEDTSKQTAIEVEKNFTKILEKKEKQKNLVVVGMPERDEESDWNRVYEMASHAGIIDPPSAIKTAYRDGIPGKKTSGGFLIPRILKIRFTNKNYRLAFLKKNYNELGEDFSRLYVRPDLTYEEREHDRALKAQLRQRRADTGNQNLIIKNGEIIDKTMWNNVTVRGNRRASQ